MAFDAGAAIGHVLLDTNDWQRGAGIVNSSTGGLKKSFGILGGAATAVGAAIAGAFVASVAKADEFQKAFSNVTTIIDTTQVNTQSLVKEIINLDSTLGSTIELTNATYQAFSSGATDAADAINITTQAAKFGKAALTDTFTAVDVLTTATNAYGKETVSAGQASDIFFKTIQRGKLTGQQLASTIGSSIPLFASTGIKLEELGASMAAMTLQGVNAAEATTQLNAIINSFLKPTDDLTKSMKAMGYESGSAFLKAEGLTGALKLLQDISKGDAAELSKLLPNVRALRGAMALSGEGGKAFADILNDMSSAAGVTDKAFKKQEKTFDTLKNQGEKLLIVAGNVGKTFVDQLAVGATEAANSMLQFLMSSKGAEIVSTIIADIASAFEVMKVAIQPIVDAIMPTFDGVMQTAQGQLNKIPGKVDDVSTGMLALSSIIQFTASAIKVFGKVTETIINVIGNLVTAIIESGKAIGNFFEFLAGKKSWDEVSESAGQAGEAFKNLGTGIVDDLSDVFKTVGQEVVSFGDKSKGTAKKMEVTFDTTFKRTKTNALNSYDSLITGQATMTDAMLADAQRYKNGLNDINKSFEDVGKGAGQNVFSSWSKTFVQMVQKARDAFKESGLFSIEFGEAVKGVLNEIDSKAQQFGSLFSDIFSQIGQISDQYYENQLTNNNNEYQKKKENIEKSLLDEEEKTNSLSALDDEYDKKNAKLKKEQFKKQKTASVVQSIINGVMAVTKTLSDWGLPWGLIPAGIMAGLAAANTAMIASQPVPQFAVGGVGNPGPVLVGEEGPEMLNLGSTSRIIPAEETFGIMRQASLSEQNRSFTVTQPLILQVDGTPIYKGLLKATKDGIALVSERGLVPA